MNVVLNASKANTFGNLLSRGWAATKRVANKVASSSVTVRTGDVYANGLGVQKLGYRMTARNPLIGMGAGAVAGAGYGATTDGNSAVGSGLAGAALGGAGGAAMTLARSGLLRHAGINVGRDLRAAAAKRAARF